MSRGLPFELFLGLRYLTARGQRTNLSLFVWIGVGGVFLGVSALIVVPYIGECSPSRSLPSENR